MKQAEAISTFLPCLDRNGIVYKNYMVSQDGQIGSNHGKSFRILKGSTGGGYRQVHLFRDTIRTVEYVHTLVARSLIGMPEDPTLQINHKDTIKTNNHFENLEWVTVSANILHAFAKGLFNTQGENNPRSKLTEDQVLEIRSLCGKEPQQALAKRYDVSTTTISHIYHRRIWKHI